MILMILSLLALGAVLFDSGTAALRASAKFRSSDNIYPNRRAAERRMDALLGWICLAADALLTTAAVLLALR